LKIEPDLEKDRLIWERRITIHPDREDFDYDTCRKVKCVDSTHTVRLYAVAEGILAGKCYYVFSQEGDLDRGLNIMGYTAEEYEKLKEQIELDDNTSFFAMSDWGLLHIPKIYRHIYRK
jgi:hypothetical protein